MIIDTDDPDIAMLVLTRYHDDDDRVDGGTTMGTEFWCDPRMPPDAVVELLTAIGDRHVRRATGGSGGLMLCTPAQLRAEVERLRSGMHGNPFEQQGRSRVGARIEL